MKMIRAQLIAGLMLATVSIARPGFALAGDKELETSIDRLSAAVEQLARLQQKSAQTTEHDTMMRRLSLAVAYLDYRSRRIEALEMERSEIRTSSERLDDILRQIERREEDLDENLRSNPQTSREEAVQARKDLQNQKKTMIERIARNDSKLIQLDNEITELKSQLVPIERFIQQNLQF